MDVRQQLGNETKGLARRRLGQLLASVGLAMVTVPLVPGRPRAASSLFYYTWEGYNTADFFPDYITRHGDAPAMQTFVDASDALDHLRAGLAVDVVHPCVDSIQNWRTADVLQPIDVSRLSHWPDVFEGLKTIAGTDTQDRQWFLPIDWGNLSVLYRPDLVDLTEESFGLLWDERYAGKLAIGDNETDTLVLAAVYGQVPNPFDMSGAELSRVKALLVRQRPLIQLYWIAAEDIERRLASGDLVASSAWNASVVRLKSQGVPVKYMTPKEGIITWCCGLVLTKTASEIDEAYDLMNAMLAPEAGKWLITQQGYGHSNRKSFDLVDDRTLSDLGLPREVDQMLANSTFMRAVARQDVYRQTLDEVIAGV